MKQPRLSIIIPVYEEKPTVAALLDQVIAAQLTGIDKQIIVVESNSKDGTRAVVQSYEAAGTIRAIYEERPMGKGHAVKAGLRVADGDWILFQDADLEYDVADYSKLLEPLQRGEAAFVLGSRHLGHSGWYYRTNKINFVLFCLVNAASWGYTLLFNVLFGQSLTDPCTMFKVFRRDCLEGISLQSDGFELDWEIVAKLVRRGYRPKELAVAYRSRSWQEGKKVRLWRDGWRGLLAIFRFRFAAF